jgi:excisionase family DNA binding protein
MQTEDRQQPYLNSPQVAAELGVTEVTVRALVAAGKLTAYRFNRWYKFTREDVDAFKQRSMVRAA